LNVRWLPNAIRRWHHRGTHETKGMSYIRQLPNAVRRWHHRGVLTVEDPAKRELFLSAVRRWHHHCYCSPPGRGELRHCRVLQRGVSTETEI
jgi:hypothetical protein